MSVYDYNRYSLYNVVDDGYITHGTSAWSSTNYVTLNWRNLDSIYHASIVNVDEDVRKDLTYEMVRVIEIVESCIVDIMIVPLVFEIDSILPVHSDSIRFRDWMSW